MLRDTIHYQVHNNRLYVEQSEKGFFIGVYSPAGELVQQIQHNLPGPVLTKRYKKESLENLRTDQLISRLIKSSGGWENFKKKATFTFPENFPAIKDLVVDGDRVYISTFICKQGKEKWVVMDLQGKLPEVAYLPIPTQSSFTVRSMGRENRFFAINKQHFYYLTEDEDNEIWQLHREPIIIVNKK